MASSTWQTDPNRTSMLDLTCRPACLLASEHDEGCHERGSDKQAVPLSPLYGLREFRYPVSDRNRIRPPQFDRLSLVEPARQAAGVHVPHDGYDPLGIISKRDSGLLHDIGGRSGSVANIRQTTQLEVRNAVRMMNTFRLCRRSSAATHVANAASAPP